MHVLIIADGDSRYGASKSMLQMTTELLSMYRDLKVSIVLKKDSNQKDDFESLGCQVYCIPYEPYYQSIPYHRWKIIPKYLLRGIGYIWSKFFADRALCKDLDISLIDIIHSNSSREDFGALLAKKYNKPFVWHIREYGDMDFKCFSFRKDYISLMNQIADQIIAVSDSVAKHWILKGINRNKIIRIYNGVEIINTNKKAFLRQNFTRIRFIMLGSLTEEKGQYQIIEAIALLSKEEKSMITLDIVGDGVKSYEQKLLNMVRCKGLDAVISFKGYCKNFHMNLGQYDCGIMCSKAEAFGRVTVEYMMAGLPVIASDTGANPEIIINKKNGLLYEYNNPSSLVEKIKFMLINKEKMEEMGQFAREYVVGKFTSRINAENVYNIYKNLFAEKSTYLY